MKFLNLVPSFYFIVWIKTSSVFPEFLEYELGGPPIRTIEVSLLQNFNIKNF